MKKLILILLMLPIIIKAQVTPGRYKLQLATANLYMELTSSNFLRVADDCRANDRNCGKQVWQILTVRGKPNTFQITLVGSGKYLTWDNEPQVSSNVSLEARYPIEKIKFQYFLIIPNDKGSYQIQPATESTSSNGYYLGAKRASGANNAIGISKNDDMTTGNFANAWRFAPPITPLPVQQSPSVIVTPPSANKLDVDIRTGGDNLEPREHQENPSIIVEINGQPNVVFLDINKNQTWVNNSFHRITIPLPANVNLEDLKSVTISRKNKHWGRDEMVSSDNWTVANVAVVANLNNKRTPLANYTSARPHNKVFRFMTMTNRGETGELNSVYGWGNEVKLSLSPIANQTPITVPTTANASIIAVFGTGGDDLRGGNDNINLSINFNSGRLPLTISNINASRKWDNFSEKTIQKILINSENIDLNDIKDIRIRHTGGGGIGADNWYLDKFKLTITKGSETKVLVDKIEAPIHYFTGDSRSKTLQILR